MKEYLTSQEHLTFKRIEKIIELREDDSLLILLGVDTELLSNSIENYFLEIQRYSPCNLKLQIY